MYVLIIDDNTAYRTGVSKAATNKGWVPIICGDVGTAKRIVLTEAPDLIIADYLLHDETVIDLLCWMKKNQVKIPVIVVSAGFEDVLSEQALRYGAEQYYDKLDFSLKKIYEILDERKI